MEVFLNGRLVPEDEAKISIFDRGFLYGDGLFETLRVCRGRPFRWADHLARLQRGAAFLQTKIPFTEAELREQARRLIEANRMPDGLLRLTLSRGIGPRGYSPKGAEHPTLAMTLHESPDRTSQPPEWRVITSSFRLPADEALAQFKTCNKLPQILARAEAEARGADEALLLNTAGEVVEASSGNLFWVEGGAVCTPPLSSGILPGVTRAVVLEICRELGVPVRDAAITAGELRWADGVFLTVSSWGVIEVVSLDEVKLPGSEVTRSIQKAYEAAVANESI